MGASGAPSLHDSGFGGFVSPIYDGLAVVGIWGSSLEPWRMTPRSNHYAVSDTFVSILLLDESN